MGNNGFDFVCGNLRCVIVWIFNRNFNSGKKLNEAAAQIFDRYAESAAELSDSGVEVCAIACVDYVQYGFGLSQVNFAVKEGAAGEFAGLSEGRPVGQQQIEDVARDEQPAVGEYFDYVLAGIRFRRFVVCESDLINVPAV